MRKISVFLIAACFCSTYATAQFQKGKSLLGMNFGITKSNEREDTAGSLNQRFSSTWIELDYGVCYKDNNVFGVALIYAPVYWSDHIFIGGDTVQASQKTYGFGVFYRNYKKLTKDLYLFSGAALDYQKTTNELTHPEPNSYNTKQVNSMISGGVSLGVTYQLYKHLQVELSLPSIISLQYQHTRYSSTFSSIDNVQNSLIVNSFLKENSSLAGLVVGFKFNF